MKKTILLILLGFSLQVLGQNYYTLKELNMNPTSQFIFTKKLTKKKTYNSKIMQGREYIVNSLKKEFHSCEIYNCEYGYYHINTYDKNSNALIESRIVILPKSDNLPFILSSKETTLILFDPTRKIYDGELEVSLIAGYYTLGNYKNFTKVKYEHSDFECTFLEDTLLKRSVETVNDL